MKARDRELRDKAKAPAAWVDPTILANAGWGVIFPASYSNEKLAALKSEDGLGVLLSHRKQQVTQQSESYYRECLYWVDQSKDEFLRQHQVPTFGAVDPDNGMPYYLLLVGSPTEIPYEFQYQLDVQYAVGRIYFDTLEEYAYYAKSVVRAETGQVERPRRASFWGVCHDRATELSSENLVKPLAQWLSHKVPDWECPTWLADQATKKNLCDQLERNSAPAILFTASHGIGYPHDDPRQRDFQGSLMCQDWEPGSGKPDPENHFFSGDDIQQLGADTDFHGLIAFHFACYGLGTPKFNDFKHRDGERQLAQDPFISRLPQRWLSHPKGGALAVIGHVDRAFSSSFQDVHGSNTTKQLVTFQSVLKCLTNGKPVGYAMEFFNQQYAELAADCSNNIRNDCPDWEIAPLWTRSTNARNYALFGDPAVRVSVSSLPTDNTRGNAPEIQAKVWFERPKKPPTQEETTTINQLRARIEQLERQVKTLQSENQQLKRDLAQ